MFRFCSAAVSFACSLGEVALSGWRKVGLLSLRSVQVFEGSKSDGQTQRSATKVSKLDQIGRKEGDALLLWFALLQILVVKLNVANETMAITKGTDSSQKFSLLLRRILPFEIIKTHKRDDNYEAKWNGITREIVSFWILLGRRCPSRWMKRDKISFGRLHFNSHCHFPYCSLLKFIVSTYAKWSNYILDLNFLQSPVDTISKWSVGSAWVDTEIQVTPATWATIILLLASKGQIWFIQQLVDCLDAIYVAKSRSRMTWI